ncbi:late secretory pathway protein AVL9 homolog [Physella acuta]|uniref:late secretory pathway protein AVL9 homolog n=1 Tax=Physella acuta TaxID=109671 RepID=UPI0027DE73A6|nr:late secretory pathway protein AVL9 homolog [Physella acuta]XP_059165263.1 late secretory pathway protein AVL9 homolog [Physella acuta]XP_059165271.1 late secretory pathway protein AVL9 homolog [Physella acuta]
MEDPVLHVMVIGFHHKKGCQVEFSYPPLIEGNSVESHEIPEEWKHIPSLALPDGAHNFVKDTVYFVLPGRSDTPHTIYGVSCYRQMDAKDLINKTADVTRSTVQKSVCVLSRLPLFGLIQAKLELITHAYFDERDFSQVALLEQTYKNLNASLTQSLLEGTQVFLGLSARELVTLYKHKVIILFKLLMLERRVLFFGSPVESLCQTILCYLSLFPGMLESGLAQACNQWSVKKLSPDLALVDINSDLDESEQFLEVRYDCSTSDSSLTDVLGHMHNSGINLGASGDTKYTGLDINDDEIEPEAPESPSIPRDVLNFDSTKLANKEKPSSKSELKLSHSHTDSQGPRSKHLLDSDKLTVHAFSKTRRQFSLDDSKLSSDRDTLHESPLANLEQITHLENVQSGVSSVEINKKNTRLDNNSNALHNEKVRRNSLTLHSTKTRMDNDELIEDLDSPESISKIDKEDCFSWEQDRLQLTIDHDIMKPEPSTASSSMSASRDSIAASESGKESISDDTASASSHEQKERAKIVIENKKKEAEESPATKQKKSKALKNKLSAAFSKKGKPKKTDDTHVLKHDGTVVLQQDQFGYPLSIFTKGAVCHPYVSLQYHDILTDVNIRSFVLGATNILFKQRRQLIDVFVEIHDGKVDIRDKDLQRKLSLTTADLRFADYLVKTVTDERPGLFLDGTEWEGSDEWIRAQFKHYLNSLLSTVDSDDVKLLDDFGTSFIDTWKTTHNYRYWMENDHSAVRDIPPGHPFQGNLSMADVRVRFNHTLQNTERGRKINAAVVQTGKYVVQTGKAVGGALTSAKSAVSGWFSSWRHSDKEQETVKEETSDPKMASDNSSQ